MNENAHFEDLIGLPTTPLRFRKLTHGPSETLDWSHPGSKAYGYVRYGYQFLRQNVNMTP